MDGNTGGAGDNLSVILGAFRASIVRARNGGGKNDHAKVHWVITGLLRVNF